MVINKIEKSALFELLESIDYEQIYYDMAILDNAKEALTLCQDTLSNKNPGFNNNLSSIETAKVQLYRDLGKVVYEYFSDKDYELNIGEFINMMSKREGADLK